MTKIRFFIADDRTVVRDGLRSMLAREPDFEVIGEAANGENEINQCQAYRHGR